MTSAAISLAREGNLSRYLQEVRGFPMLAEEEVPALEGLVADPSELRCGGHCHIEGLARREFQSHISLPYRRGPRCLDFHIGLVAIAPQQIYDRAAHRFRKTVAPW